MRLKQFRALLARCLFCVALPAFVPAAQAALVNYDLNVQLDSGPLTGNAGNPFSGSFSFDDALSYPIDLTSFSFAFVDSAGTAFDYGLGDADVPPTAEEDVFSSGTFVGISYSFTGTGISFQFAPGFFALSEATFSYVQNSNPGTGVLTITETAEAPAPATLALLLLGVVGLAARRRGAAPPAG